MAKTPGQHKVKIDMVANTKSAVKDTQALAKEVQRLTKENERLNKTQAQGKKPAQEQSQAFSGLTKALGGTVGKLGAYGAAAAAAIVGGVKLAQTARELAVEYNKNVNTFNNLQFSLDKARVATQGLINDQELALAANKAAAFGVAKTSEEFASLAGAAQRLAAIQGTEVGEALDSAVVALSRQSTAILDNLGITLKMEQAQELYAKSIGKNVSQLNDAEKAEAFRVIALQKIKENSEKASLATDNLAAKVLKLGVAWDNTYTEIMGGVEPKVLKYVDGLRQLDERQLRLAKNALTYGADLDTLKKIFADMGVEIKSTEFDVRDLADALKKLDQINREIAQKNLDAATDNAKKLAHTIQDAAVAQQKHEQEVELAYLEAKGAKQSEISSAKSRYAAIEIQHLKETGKMEEAINLERSEEIRLAGEMGRVDAKNHSAKKKQTMEQIAFASQLRQIRLEQAGFAMQRAGSDTRDIEAEASLARKNNVAAQIQRSSKEEERARKETLAEMQRSKEMRRIETRTALSRKTPEQSIALIDAETDAEVRYLQTMKRIETDVNRKAAIDEQLKETYHRAEIQRINARVAARQYEIQNQHAAMDASVQIMGQGIAFAEQAAAAAGKTGRKTQLAFMVLHGIEALVIGALEQVKAVRDFASFNYVGGALHQSAAIFAWAQGGLLMSGKVPRAGGRGGGASGGRQRVDIPGQSQSGKINDIPGSPGALPNQGKGKPTGSDKPSVIVTPVVFTNDPKFRDVVGNANADFLRTPNGQKRNK